MREQRKRHSAFWAGSVLALILCGGLPAGLLAVDETERRARVARASTQPTVDGRVQEAVWLEATHLTAFLQAEPQEGAPPSEQTTVLLLYNADFLYIGLRAFDAEPDRIVAKTRQRDSRLDGDDSFAVTLDTFLDRRHGYYFQINPLGTQRDGLIAPDTDTETDALPYQADWDGIWHAAAVIDKSGWTAELAIPLKTIRFDPSSSTWGFNVQRTIARKNEIVRWTAASRNKHVTAMGDAGQIDNLVGLRQGLGLDLVPSATLKLARNHQRARTAVRFDPSLDLFYHVTPAITLALTFNTDFAETEVDERQVNFTRFPLFFAEKRDFFLQDANYFRFGGIHTSPLPFFSRRIGLSAEGTPIDLLGGVKATGRIGRVNFGLLDVYLDEHRNLPAKNLAVGRATFDVFEESAIGAIFTSGDPERRGDAHLVGVDFQHKASNFRGTGQIVEANGYVMRSSRDGASGYAWGGRLLYPNFTWNAALNFDQVDPRFSPALGFLEQSGVRSYEGWLGRTWRPSILDSLYLELYGRMRTRLDGAVIDRELLLPYLRIETKSRDRIFAGAHLGREQFFEPFLLVEDLVVPARDYHYLRYFFGGETAKTRALAGYVEVAVGDYLHGTRTETIGRITWRPGSWVDLTASYERNAFSLPGEAFTVHLAQGSVNIAITPTLTLRLIGQYDNVSDEFGLNSRLRWLTAPGNDVFLVFNYLADAAPGGWRSLHSEATSKVVWTFRF